MKKTILLDKNWELCQADVPGSSWMSVRQMPSQVQEVLLDHGILPQEVLLGWCQKAQWIADCEWEYKCSFRKPDFQRCRLVCKGLDTLASIYLNGTLIGTHDDFYIPEMIEITNLCKEENELIIRFHSVLKWLEKQQLPKYLQGAVLKCKLIRKPLHDFPLKNGPEESNYQGAVPGFTPTGIYDQIYLETWDSAEIKEDHICATVENDGSGKISFSVHGENKQQIPIDIEACVSFNGEKIKTACIKTTDTPDFSAEGSFKIENPQLWWPVRFGEHPLYTVEISVKNHETAAIEDTLQKKVGFRKIEILAPLAFRINGKIVRLWGGSMDPMQGYTHCYKPDRAKRIFEMVEHANMNTLRIWGEGIPLPDEFYQEADQRGILIWQEFFMGYGAYPDSETYGNKCIREAEILIRRIRHHASLLMWCGGNETILGAEFAGKQPFGDWIAKKAFPHLLKQLDPERYYHINSPYGGTWSNDPREGDTHTYETEWEYPYVEYPNFISECFRTAPPDSYSLEHFIRGPLWPQDYDFRVTRPDQGIMPDNWRQRSHLQVNGERYSGPYWEYYEPTDADSMIYRFQASYAAEIKRIGEQVRRGSREPADITKRSKGYMACKLLDTWPKVFCAVIDYFQEGHSPYYATKRMLEPITVCFAKEESIRLFAVNDSPDDFSGFVELGIYHLRKELFIQRELLPVSVKQGDFSEITDLSKYGFFSKDCALYARLMYESGKEVCTCIDYVDIERHLPFHDPQLQVNIQGDSIQIQAMRFARCVELTGNCDGDAFGWLFEDNYFDLMPGITKSIKILGKHNHGTIQIKAHYSDCIKEIYWERKDLK